MSQLIPIQGFEERYAVSEDGRVWSFLRAKWLRAGINSAGYACVVLHSPGVRITKTIHRLVAEAYLGPVPFVGAEINHRDGVKTHNVRTNLEWCTRSQNVQHALRSGLIPRQVGRHKFSMVIAIEVRRLVAAGAKQIDVARSLGTTKQLIGDIVHNRTYRP